MSLSDVTSLLSAATLEPPSMGLATPAVKNVVVLGAAYAGARCAQLIALGLPRTHRVVLVDRQSHHNHVYMFPRASVLSGQAPKCFVPNTHIFGLPNEPAPAEQTTPVEETLAAGDLVKDPVCPPELKQATSNGEFIQADVDRITLGKMTLHKALPSPLSSSLTDLVPTASPVNPTPTEIEWDYLVYALGCALPPPLHNLARSKTDGIAFLHRQQALIATSSSILIIGGGALGLQYATDIASLYGTPSAPPSHLSDEFRPANARPGPKRVMLVHSRNSFLPLFAPEVGAEALRRLRELGVDVVLNEKLTALPSWDEEASWMSEGEGRGPKKVTLSDGRELEFDLLLRCTGQKPNSALLQGLLPEAVNERGFVNVKPTTQVDAGPDAPEWASKVFAVGDVADAGVIKAGHVGWAQGEVAARNVLNEIKRRQAHEAGVDVAVAPVTLEDYDKTPPMIHLTLGLGHSVSELLPHPDPDSTDPPSDKTVITKSSTEAVSGHWDLVWKRRGVDPAIVGEMA